MVLAHAPYRIPAECGRSAGAAHQRRRTVVLAGFARSACEPKAEERQGATRTCGAYCPTSLFPYSPQTPASHHSCLLPTWWFWRGGCTRSHSEHGRETPQRRWYFVSRRGRVGRCQVCKTHECFSNLLFAIPAGQNGSWAAQAALVIPEQHQILAKTNASDQR